MPLASVVWPPDYAKSMPRLFVYGTLRDPEIQKEIFGRVVPMVPERLAGYRLEHIQIENPYVLETSGMSVHRILVADADATEPIEGFSLEITEDELARADIYEDADYARVLAPLESGRSAFVYVAPTA